LIVWLLGLVEEKFWPFEIKFLKDLEFWLILIKFPWKFEFSLTTEFTLSFGKLELLFKDLEFWVWMYLLIVGLFVLKDLLILLWKESDIDILADLIKELLDFLINFLCSFSLIYFFKARDSFSVRG